jgi:hypothetical protein
MIVLKITYLGNDHLTWKRGWVITYDFFSKKNILIPNVAEKKYSDFCGGKKKSDSEFLSYPTVSRDICSVMQ